MEIKIFMDNPSDDFSAFTAVDLAGTGWFDGKLKPQHDPSALAPLVPIKTRGKNKQAVALKNLFLRKEAFGGIVFEGTTGRVFQVDKAAFQLLSKLQAGAPVAKAIPKSKTAKDRVAVKRFIKALAKHKVLSTKMVKAALATLEE